MSRAAGADRRTFTTRSSKAPRSGPAGHATTSALEPADRYLFIAGGIGITPILPMLAAADADGRPWTLTYGGRTAASMAFRADLLARYPGRVRIRPQDETGLLDLAGILDGLQPGTLVYCCGPAPLLDALADHCAGWPAGHAARRAVHRRRPPTRRRPGRASRSSLPRRG